MSTHVLVPVGELYSPADGTPLYKPYGYVPPQRVCFLRRFGLKTCIDQALVVRKVGNAIHQASVVQTLDSAIHRINHYPADKYYGNQLRYPLDRFLSGG